MSQSEIPSSNSISEPTGGISRRVVLLAGAWAAPAIAVASAVPAASASVVEKMTFTNFDAWFGTAATGYRGQIDGTTAVGLEGDSGASVGPVTLVVSVPAAGMSTAKPLIDQAPTLWVAEAGVVNGTSMNYTFTYGGTLIAGGDAAYTTTLTFHLAAEPGVFLAPPLTVSAVAMAAGAANGVDSETLPSLGDVTALPGALILQAGSLAQQGIDTLVWSGASIIYDDPNPATVEYVVELRGPLGGDLALLAYANASVSITPTVLGPITYTTPTGLPLTPGNHSVVLTVVGVGGTRTAITPPLDVVL